MDKNKKIIITESQLHIIKEFMSNDVINKRAKEIDESPTEAQCKAGNYKMAHVTFSGFKITIENAKGSKRYWKDEKGNIGYNVMKHHYGYFSNSLGHDGDHVDVFLGDNQESDKIYVVDQNKKDKSFDESKVMLGFNSKKEAKEAYMSNFSSDWKGFRCITGVSKKLFKKWLYNGRKQQKPFADYVEVVKKKLNENTNNNVEDLVLTSEPTESEIKTEKRRKQRAKANERAREKRKEEKERKRKEAEDAFWNEQRKRGYKGLFGDF